MPTFAELKTQADSPTQVRKVLEAVAFLAPEDAAEITSLTDATGKLVALPAQYVPVGIVTRDGYTFGGDTTTEPVDALGYAQPIREDITGYTRTVSFTAYEVFRKAVLELAYAMDLSAVTQALSGEVTFNRPALPAQRFYRLIVIGKDGSGDTEIYRAKFFPRVSLTSVPEEAWNTSALSFQITLSTYVDDALGTGEREFIAGPGAAAHAGELGFTQAG